MALRSITVSDLTGNEIVNGDAIEITVRNHPAFPDRRLDAIKGELDALKTVSGLVTLEIKDKAGQVTEVACTAAELAKVVTDEILEAAPGTRGRKPGWSPRV
jgi:hypothetical protein